MASEGRSCGLTECMLALLQQQGLAAISSGCPTSQKMAGGLPCLVLTAGPLWHLINLYSDHLRTLRFLAQKWLHLTTQSWLPHWTSIKVGTQMDAQEPSLTDWPAEARSVCRLVLASEIQPEIQSKHSLDHRPDSQPEDTGIS